MKLNFKKLLKKLIGKNKSVFVRVKFDESCMHKYCIQIHTSIKSNLSSKEGIFTYSFCNIYCEIFSVKLNMPKKKKKNSKI